MDELDAYRAAKLLLDGKGDQAPAAAWRRADALLSAGDGAGWNAWLRIIKAIDALQALQPVEGQSMQ